MSDPDRASSLTSTERRIVLVAGPSGSGKGVMTRRSGVPLLALDEFYRDLDDPGLPRRFGIVDWDDPASWDRDAALEALAVLCRDGRADVPTYSISTSRRTGSRRLDVTGHRLIAAEGIFAAELVGPLTEAGLLADAVVIDRPALLVFALRLVRDLKEARKPPLTLLRRGWALAREQRSDIARWQAAGMRPVGLRSGVRHLRALAATPGPLDSVVADDAVSGTAADAGPRAPRDAPAHPGSTPVHPGDAPVDRGPSTTQLAPDTMAHAKGIPTIHVAAVCFLRAAADGWELLAVRKRGTETYMQVGGKIEPGEDPRDTAVREVGEELGALLDPEDLEFLGRYRAAAANEAATDVLADVFLAPSEALPRDVEAQAEIDDVRWFPLDGFPLHGKAGGVRLAPLTREHIAPSLRARLSPP
ncbi:MAG: NUDIX domain-containing protein [Brachybacterium sp.]|nr:NUDIX domain-containing protein [Brachybacterium sp.]